MKQTFTIGVFAIVEDPEGRILLALRTDRDMWNLPGGGLESGEAPSEGVIREVREETGFDVVVRRVAGVYAKPHDNDVVITFECVIVGGERTLNAEARDIAFFAYEELPPNLSQRHRERISDVLMRRNETVMRVQ